MDYIPPKRNDRYLWLKNFSAHVQAEAVKFGGVAGDATAAKAIADNIVAKMDLTEAAVVTADAARGIEHTVDAAGQVSLRTQIRNWKTLTGYVASGSEGILQLKGPAVSFDHNTYKPVIKAAQEADVIKISFTKKGVDSIAIYSRLRGTSTWNKIGVDTSTPYYDTHPLAVAGVPEAREYMARGVLHDEEIGVDSDIASITFAG